MEKIWLAAVLGVILGVGLAISPASIGPTKAYLPITTAQQERELQASPNGTPVSQAIILALIAGLLVGAPFFLVTKNRYR